MTLTCGNNLCVRPDHLRAVPKADIARRNHPRVFTPDEVAEMRRLYEQEQLSAAEVAERFTATANGVWMRLRAEGVQMRPFNWRRPRRVRHSQGYWLYGGEYEHRIVAQRMLGRQLRPGEVVHHKNGDKTDNRPENLQVLPSNSAHTRLHAEQRRRAARGESQPGSWMCDG